MPFALNELTALLPCDEADFAFGIVPAVRAALPASQAGVARPDLVTTPARSLFATVAQAYRFWGRVARGACLDAPAGAASHLASHLASRLASSSPAADDSDGGLPPAYVEQAAELAAWEASLAPAHTWSAWNLRVYRAQHQDLAYASIFLALRLCHIVLRVTYLSAMRAAVAVGDNNNNNINESPFASMALDLFDHVASLDDGIALLTAACPLALDASGTSATAAFPPLLPFSCYACGSLATQLRRFPALSPRRADRAPAILARAMANLAAMTRAWPIAAHWHTTLAAAGTAEAAAAAAAAETATMLAEITGMETATADTEEPAAMVLRRSLPFDGDPYRPGTILLGDEAQSAR